MPTIDAMKRALHEMDMNNWSWNSAASTDAKREAHRGLREAIAADEAKAVAPMTEDQIIEIFKTADSEDRGRWAVVLAFARAIEAYHGIGVKP